MKKKLKIRIFLISLAALLLFSVGGTIAFLTAQTDPLTNEFKDSYVSCKVEQESGGAYNVTNTSDIPAYIRATVVVTWQDTDGNVYYKKPECIIAPTGFTFRAEDGYYYCTSPIAASTLAGSFYVHTEETVEGYTLKVEVLAQAIQADGKDSSDKSPVTLAWGVEVDGNGNLIINPSNP